MEKDLTQKCQFLRCLIRLIQTVNLFLITGLIIFLAQVDGGGQKYTIRRGMSEGLRDFKHSKMILLFIIFIETSKNQLLNIWTQEFSQWEMFYQKLLPNPHLNYDWKVISFWTQKNHFQNDLFYSSRFEPFVSLFKIVEHHLELFYLLSNDWTKI